MKKMKASLSGLFALLMLLPVLVGCAAEQVDPYIALSPMTILEDEAVAMADAPAPEAPLFTATASGTAVKKAKNGIIDYSNVKDGYVMVKYTAETDRRLKAQVKGPNVTYTYNLTAGEWVVFPLAEGDGKYTVTLYINAKDSKYAAVVSKTFTVALENEFLPFLYANQYVDYTNAPNAVAKAAELTADAESTLDKVAAVYDYVVSELTYDSEKAASVKSGYLPVLDEVMEAKKGICFDYAALMAGMLRSQSIPCQLVVGYAGKSYHAWISVWTEEKGWIDGVIRFDGTSWQRMDPTFASSANKSASIMKYIGDGKNYTQKYLY